MKLTIEPLTEANFPDLDELFGTDPSAARCRCMWFIIPVRAYHAAGEAGNRASLVELLATANEPLGLLGYHDGRPVGRCAVGPRSRYVRAIKTPTYKGRDPEGDERVWLVPCFFVRQEARRIGVTLVLLEAAVALARRYGAAAIEGFPLAAGKRQSKGDLQVGFESVFAACGFEIVRSPSTQRA